MILPQAKRRYAEDVAAALGFTWDYENADDNALFEAVELCHYVWNANTWCFDPNGLLFQDLAQKAAWNTSQPISTHGQQSTLDDLPLFQTPNQRGE